MPSKREITCQYKFKQGAKKGKKCGRTCRGRFCCDHKQKKIKYLKNYREKTKEKNFNTKLEKLKVKDSSNVSLEKEQHKLKLYTEELIDLLKNYIGIIKFLGYDDFYEKYLEIIKKHLCGKCKCISIEKLIEENYDELVNDKEFIFYHKGKHEPGTDEFNKRLYEYIDSTYKCRDINREDNCHKYSMEYFECKYCHPRNRVFFHEFTGDKKYALFKYNKNKKKINILNKKIKQQKEIIKLINKNI
jgi:hypothetical protein